MKNLKIAWRNLWRNKGRTLITVAAVFFGVLMSTLMSSLQEGSYSSMVQNVVQFYSGYMQVQNEDYWEEKTIHNTFKPSDSLLDAIHKIKDVTQIAPRLESFALASSEEVTKGTILFGIDPDQEQKITNINRWLSEGQLLSPGDAGVLVAEDLAKHLGVSIDDTLVLLGQGYHGVSAAGKYPVRGIISLPNPDLNRQMVYMDIATCQEFFSAEGLVTAIIVMVGDPYDLPKASRHLKNEILAPYKVMTWEEMQPELVQMIEADRVGGVVMKGILYMIIGFGILGTITMMLSERLREMGVMVAIGMQRLQLGIILFIETILIGLVGVFSGFAASIPIIYKLYKNPLPLPGEAAETMIEMGIEPNLYFSWTPSVFYNQVIIVFLITALIGILPLIRVSKLSIPNALRAH